MILRCRQCADLFEAGEEDDVGELRDFCSQDCYDEWLDGDQDDSWDEDAEEDE